MSSQSDLIWLGTWAMQMGRTPSPDEIMEEFPYISRATAYRWRRALLDAWGLDHTDSYLKVGHPPVAA